MKKKVIIISAIIIILFIVSIFVPVRNENTWINDDKIAEVGHYELNYYNIYGGNITNFITLFTNK